MITGFNTDIEHKGVTYHVQTEDKGLTTPLILSLVYDRGTILASKRSPYDDLLIPAFDEKALSERLQKQHKLICAAVRAGRIEDLKRMTMKESALKQKKLIAQKEVKPVIELKEINSQETESQLETKQPKLAPSVIKKNIEPIESTLNLKPISDLPIPAAEEKIETTTKKPTAETILEFLPDIVEEPIIEAVQIIEEETILPADAVEIITESSKIENPPGNKLKIGLLTDTNFKGGERKTINIMVWRDTMEKGLNGANILVKIIGSSFSPLIFHAKTDSNGVATIHLQLPHFRAGRAAILIKAASEGEEGELRRIITHS